MLILEIIHYQTFKAGDSSSKTNNHDDAITNKKNQSLLKKNQALFKI